MRRRLPIRLLAVLLIGCLAPPGGALRAAEAGGGYEAGLRALDAGRPQEALSIWTALAAQGDGASIYGLGRLYEVGGPGFEPDKAKAAEWYGKAASAGVVAAQNNLALLYAKGEGVTRDPAMAAGLWRQAAERGHATAQYNLGLLELRGEGVGRDEAAGAAWVRKAADAGIPAAQFVMGDLRRYGIGMDEDPGRALTWYLRAAASGYAPARAEAEQLTASGVLARGEGPAQGGGTPAAEPEAPPPDRTDAASGMASDGARPAEAAAPPPRPTPPSPQLPPGEDAGAGDGTRFLRDRLATAEAGPAPGPAPLPSPAKPADLQRAARLEAALPEAADAEALAADAAPSGRFALWLGSASGRAAGERLARGLAERHRAVLGEPAVVLRRVEVEGLGAVYRVLAGDWPDRAAAEAACGRLRAADPSVFCSATAQ